MMANTFLDNVKLIPCTSLSVERKVIMHISVHNAILILAILHYELSTCVDLHETSGYIDDRSQSHTKYRHRKTSKPRFLLK